MVAVSGSGRIALGVALLHQQQTGRCHRFGICNRLAVRHFLVAVCLHAHLCRAQCRIDCAGHCGARHGLGGLLRYRLRRLLAVAPARAVAQHAGVCRTVDHGRDGPRHVADRFWLGCHRLCPCRWSPGGLDSLGRLLRCGFPGGVGVGSGYRGLERWLGDAAGAGACVGGRAGPCVLGAGAAARLVLASR